MNQWNPSTLQVKTNQSSAASEFRFYNTSAFPGKIKQVVIKFSALTLSNTSTTGFMFVGGTSEVTATTGGTNGTWDSNNNTITWTPNATDNYTYFAFYQNGKVATGTNKLAEKDAIVVTYETSGGNGTENNPYSVAQALANAPSTGTSDYVYVKGIVSKFYADDIMSDGTNYRYYISDDGATNNQLLVYQGKKSNTDAFSSVDDLRTGDLVVIYGQLKKYSSVTEFEPGNYIVSLKRELANANLSFSETSYTTTLGEDFTAPTLTNPHNLTVSYSSSNPEYATVDETTGAVSLVATGTTTITASSAETATYAAGSASYTLTVETQFVIEDGVFDFGAKQSDYNSGVSTTTDGATYVTDNKTWTAGNVTLVTSGKYRWWDADGSIRYYTDGNSKLTFSVPEGYEITNIVFECNSGKTAMTTEVGNYSVSGTTGTWTGRANTVILSTSALQVKKIIVTYGEEVAAVKEPVISLVSGTYVGTQSVTITCNTEGATIYYTTDGTDPTTTSTEYTGAITIDKTTTLKAIAIKNGMTNSTIVSASYTIKTVVDGVFDFASKFTDYDSGVETTSDGQTYVTEPKTWTAGNVMLVTSGKYRWWDNDGTLRFYNNTPNSSMTISVPNGYVITKIVIDGGQNFSANVGTYSSGTWTGESQEVVLSCTVTSGSVNVKMVTVIYEKGVSKQDPALTYSTTTATVNLGEAFVAPTLSYAEGFTGTIIYSSTNEEVAKLDATGAVSIVGIGSTTIKAEFAGDENYNASSASYTLTVVDPNALGGANNPYTVAQARAAIDAGTGVEKVYATGIVCKASNSLYSNKYLSYYISEDGKNDSPQLEAYNGLGVDGAPFTSVDDIKVGDVVVIYGNLTKYNSTYEFAANNQLVSLKRAPATPTFSPEPNEAERIFDSQEVTINCETEGAEIYYQLDGSEDAVKYEAPFTLTETTAVRAWAQIGEMKSKVVEANYIIVPAVASIDEVKYETLGEAFEMAEAGQTVTLLNNTEVTSAITVDKNVKLVLAGNVVENNVGNAFLFTIAEGCSLEIDGDAEGSGMTIPSTNTTAKGFVSHGGHANVTLNVHGGKYSGNMTKDAHNKAYFWAFGDAANLSYTLNNVTTESNIYVLDINSDSENNVLNVTNCTFTDTGDHCVMSVGGINLTATFNGVTVNTEKSLIVEVAGAKATFTDCNFTNPSANETGWMNSALSASYNADVTIESGTYGGTQAVYLLPSSGKVTINGGTFTGEVKSSIASNNYGLPYYSGVSELVITGGTFNNCTLTVEDTDQTEGHVAKITVSGGIFDKSVPEEFCAEGYICAANPDPETSTAYPYAVRKVIYVANLGRYDADTDEYSWTKYTDAKEAFNAVQSGDELWLWASANEDLTLPIDGEVTIVAWGEGVTYTGEVSAPEGYLVETEDLTEDYKVNDGLVQSAILYKTVVDAAKAPVRVFDKDGNLKSGYMTLPTLYSPKLVDGDVVRLYSDCTYSSSTGRYLPANATLDLNGHTLTNTDGSGIATYSSNGGKTLTIKDSSEEKTGKITCSVANSPVLLAGVHGTLIIEGGNFEAPSNSNKGIFGTIAEDAKVIISGGIFNQPVPEEFCAEGYIPTDLGEGKYGVKASAYVAQVGEQKYETLQAAIDAAEEGETVKLLKDIELEQTETVDGVKKYGARVEKSIIIDGDGHKLSGNANRSIGIKGTDSSNKINVAIKNLNIENAQNGGGAIFTRGNLNSLTLNNVNLILSSTGGGYNQPLTISGNAGTEETNNIVEVKLDGCTLESAPNCEYGYAIINWVPANVEIKNSVIKGWACLYAKPNSKGTTYTVEESELISSNQNAGDWNSFGVIVLEDKDITVNVTNTKIDISGTKNTQSIATFNNYWATASNNSTAGSTVTLGEGNTIIMKDDAQFTVGSVNDGDENGGNLIISGGIFDKPVPEQYCAEGMIPVDLGDGKYGVKLYISAPIIFHDSGEYESELQIAMAGEGTIMYTLNDGEAQTYSAPFTITEDATIKAWAVKDGVASDVTEPKTFTIKEKAKGAVVEDGYYTIQTNDGKYVNVAGRKTVTLVSDTKSAGTVIRVKADEDGVKVLRSQAVDLPRYAERAMSYVPEIVKEVVNKLAGSVDDPIIGEEGAELILDKFNQEFDYHLYLEKTGDAYRIYGRTPSMKPVVDFYAENKELVDSRLPKVEDFVKEVLQKIVDKVGHGQSVVDMFKVKTVWTNMGGTLTDPDVDQAKFFEEVLSSEKNTWEFAYQTGMLYWDKVKSYLEDNTSELGDYGKYIEKIPQIRPNFKYYIVPSTSGVDIISEGNSEIADASTAWTLTKRDGFDVTFDASLSKNNGKEMYKTLYVDFAYELPENVKAYAITGINETTGFATKEEISGVIAAQTPVLLQATFDAEQTADQTMTLTLSTKAGTTPETNLLVGADYLINEYEINTPQVESIFSMLAKLSQSLANEYSYLKRKNAGTVNNKYFFGIAVEGELDKAYEEKTGDEMENTPVRILSMGNQKLGFYGSWDPVKNNEAFIVTENEELDPVKLTLKGDVDRDGDVDEDDLKALVKIVLGKVTLENNPDDYDFDAAHVNEDEDINIADVTALVNILKPQPQD